MKIEYIKEGMKITHTTGIVQILSLENLTLLKQWREQRKTEINESITRINAHIKNAKSALNIER